MYNKQIELIFDSLVQGQSPFLQGMGFDLKKDRTTFTKKHGECTQELYFMFRHLKGKEAGCVEVNPSVTFENVEKVVAALKGEKFKKGWPTASANIGNLQSKREFIEWPITLTTEISNLAPIITYCIENIARKFWEDFSTLDSLIEGYEKSDIRLIINGNSYKWRLIAAYCLKNEVNKAIKTLDDWKVGRPSDSMVENCRCRINEFGRIL